MSNLSRTAVLFSTAVLGGALLTTSVTSTATVAYAAEITASNLSFDMTNSLAQPVQSTSVDERGLPVKSQHTHCAFCKLTMMKSQWQLVICWIRLK